MHGSHHTTTLHTLLYSNPTFVHLTAPVPHHVPTLGAECIRILGASSSSSSYVDPQEHAVGPLDGPGILVEARHSTSEVGQEHHRSLARLLHRPADGAIL